MKIPVSELIVRYMERLGIKHIFGMPGAHILPVYDALYHSPIDAILAKHEQGAAFMAGGYARISGHIGACIATAGPGATNLVTGVANAYADRQPLLVITGEAPTYIFGKGGLQESTGEGGSIDQHSLFTGITRYHRLVERVDYLPQVLTQCARILLSPNPGPVLLSLPYNLQKEEVEETLLEQIEFTSASAPQVSQTQVARLVELLHGAQNPVIIAGYGALRAGAQAAVETLSERLHIPVTTSLKGKGVIDEDAPLALGSLGVTSSGMAYRYILDQADLLLLLGAGFNERTSYVWDHALLAGKTLVQVDINEQQLGKTFRPDLAIQADVRELLEALLAQLDEAQAEGSDGPTTRVAARKSVTQQDYAIFQSGFALIEYLFQRLEQALPSGATLFDDNIIFAQNFYNVSAGNHYHPNSGISSLGHAIPAAIGARFACDDAMFAIIGDGGFQMCCMELMTAVSYAIPLNVILLNNGTMGLIRKNQAQHYGGRYLNSDLVNPDFALLAHAFGIQHHRIETTTDVDRLFASADLHHSINLIEVLIDKDLFPNYSSRR